MIQEFVQTVNDILWGQGRLLIVMLTAAGIWFSWKLDFIQFRYFKHMFSLLGGSRESNKSGISSFQALCTSLSARVGIGNLTGVAVAISLGGSGAIFWMWIIALLGMATGFAESALGQLYKVKDINGEYRGGPAYYIQQGLNKRWLAIIFSVSIFIGYGFIFSAAQTNSITDALEHAYSFDRFYTGLVVMIIAGLIVVGGMKSIAKFSGLIIPFMGMSYVVITLIITVLNIDLMPAILADIFSSAFGFNEAAGGAMGTAIKIGMQRGLFSNEAGSGSVPQAAAAAVPYPPHPVSQGFIQMLGVFFDTMVLCTCTAFIILLAGGSAGELEGIRMTQMAMEHHIGAGGSDFVAATITLFAFTSVVANYAYGESNLHMFKLDNKLGRTFYTVAYLVMILWGSTAELTEVLALADMALGTMTVINVSAILLMTATIVAISKDYFKQRDEGKLPEYRRGSVVVQGDTEKGIWPEASELKEQQQTTKELKLEGDAS
ncbi:alanine:cation symporter family protein [Alteromonadaceae bacterium M269]|nr:alanine:cation symporter family protein [Alteromonadaceae bacterium M269]